MIHYEYFNNDNLLIIKFIGDTDKNTIIALMKHIYKNTDARNLQKIFCDLRSAEIKFTKSDLKEIAFSRNEVSKGFPNTHTVYLVREPQIALLAMSAGVAFNNESAQIHISFTVNYCIKNLNLSYSVAELNALIENLKNVY